MAPPPSVAKMHNVFHVSQLRKYTPNPDQIVELKKLDIQANLTKTKFLVRIMDTKEQQLRKRITKITKYVKIQ